ncbi:hypothetical protein NT6N_38830 [Oceaniferula spumae]|uniref:Serine protease n=1 Tax=Oceaniferula spumae TaxID=2979115 RepID=A0AAT9FS84_9BACT
MRSCIKIIFVVLTLGGLPAGAQEALKVIEKLAAADPKPFVIIEGSGEKTKNRAQGVVISSKGHVLSVGHVAWISDDNAFTEKFRISFRGKGENLPKGMAHKHKTLFADRENAAFFEQYYSAKIHKSGGSRFVVGGDLAVFKMEGKGDFPKMEFYSKSKPELALGETLHLCHFTFPHKAADPYFLINPVEIVGVAQTAHGLQYLAKGYYRIGSSGGAILKNGKLIGIQASAYTVNAKGVGEVPLGLISFELVWSDQFKEALDSAAKKEK